MFNIMIADDEELERRAIKTIVSSSFKDEFSVYEAKNGREAIEIYDKIKPDVIIMDIKMPGINGMEAIKEIRKINKEVYFMILTAYDYFAYAKEAMEYEVKEYILKPLKRDELVSKLNKAITYINNLKLNRKREIKFKETMYNMIPIIESELSFAIMNNKLTDVNYINHLEYLNMELKAGYCMVLMLKGNSNLDKNDKNILKSKILDYSREYISGFQKVIINHLITENIVLFIEIDESFDENTIKMNSISIARRLGEILKNKFRVDTGFGIGKPYGGIENLYKSYKEAMAALSEYASDKSVIHFGDNSPLKEASDILYNSAVLTGSQLLIVDNNISKVSSDNQKEVIRKAVKYMKENYNKDIMLEEVAGIINISPFYFSKIFKEYMGKNYVDYITELRIEKAKEMLKKGEISIKEICYEVGYNDPNYFSRVFKKIEGLSPSEYKFKSAI